MKTLEQKQWGHVKSRNLGFITIFNMLLKEDSLSTPVQMLNFK